MLRVAIVLTVAGIGLAGAAHGQSRSLTEAEKKIIANAYGSNLKDPQSAQYQWADLVVDPSTKRRSGDLLLSSQRQEQLRRLHWLSHYRRLCEAKERKNCQLSV